jgi:hypothetical protein
MKNLEFRLSHNVGSLADVPGGNEAGIRNQKNTGTPKLAHQCSEARQGICPIVNAGGGFEFRLLHMGVVFLRHMIADVSKDQNQPRISQIPRINFCEIRGIRGKFFWLRLCQFRLQ